MTPPWLPLRADLPGREEAVAAVLARLAEVGEACAWGPPGVGKTALAGAVAARANRAIVGVSLLGCEDAPDALRALGEALGARPMGDEGGILAAARTLGPALLVADDANEGVADAVRRVAGSAPELQLLLLSERPLGDLAVELPPIGNPLQARLAAALGPDAVARLQARAALHAAFPTGLPGTADLPAVALLPDLADRTVLRRGVAVLLRPLPTAEAAILGLARVAPLLRLADGGHLAEAPDSRDLLLLRQLARTAPDPLERARCWSAASRIAAAAGQIDVARALVAEPLRRATSPVERACLLWADADAILAAGEVEEALARYGDASEWYRRGREPLMNATMLRRAGDRLAARGHITAAEREYRQARFFYRSAQNALGVAATVRGSADLAVAGGEWVGAGVLHEQVGAALEHGSDVDIERSNLRIGEISLAIARGEYARAEEGLQALGALAAGDILLRANVGRRRADLLLRRGDHDGARVEARRAAQIYASIGETAAHAASVRLEADVDAAAGRLTEAAAAYDRTVRLQVRIQDLRGLMRTLEHASLVEEALGRPEAARLRREQRAAVVGVLEGG